MSRKLVSGMLVGLVLGAALGSIYGNTGIGVAICMAAGAVAAGIWHWLDTRNPPGGQP